MMNLCCIIEAGGLTCTEGWKLNPVQMTCIKFFSETKTAINAKADCELLGASLLMLNSEEVIEWYQNLLAEKPCKCVWTSAAFL